MSGNDEGDTPIESLYDLIGEAANARAEEINTCFPAQVIAYDAATQTATLRPCVQRPVRDEDGLPQAEELPDMLGVPVAFPRAGDFVLHMPIAAGDFLLVLCATWSLSEWRRQGGARVDPGDSRHHSLGNAVAIAGVFPSGQKVQGLSASSILLGKVAGPNVKISATKVQLGANGPYKAAARSGDAVQVTIDSAAVAGIVAPPMGGACTLADGAITLSGTITGVGSSKVDISD